MLSYCYPGLIRVNMLELTNHNYVPLSFSFQSPFKEGMVTASHQFSTSSRQYSNYAKITFVNYVLGKSYTINVTVQVQ